MARIQTKLKKAFLIAASTTLLVVVFILDIIRKSVGLEGGVLMIVRELMVILAFGVLYIFIESLWQREQSPAKKLGFALVLTLVIGTASSMLFLISPSGFDVKNYALIPLGYDSLVWANIYGAVLGITMIIVLLIMRDIIFSKRRRGTNRNFIIFLVLGLATALSTFGSRPLETNILTSILYGLTIVAMLLNSFRLSWIVFLSKREKIYNIVYGFLLFCLFIGFDIVTSKGIEVGKFLAFYSAPLQSFITTVSIFATIYFGMTFISTLFHLPTAEAFDRKISEVSSLHNLSRLVTQVFDFNELVDSVTTMTLEVCEAKSSWLEIIHSGNSNPRGLRSTIRQDSDVKTVALKNISREDTESIMASHGDTFRKLILEGRKPIVIDSVKNDKRVEKLDGVKKKFNSMAIVPLLSHDNVIGILYATKDVEYGFDRDDVEVISAFADQATIAIENSRLFEKSLERERLMREMMLAQDMQRKLLPQAVPLLREVEIEALSTPAFEVGGDYYDFMMLDEDHLGILVGDVSGKGVSAAFYMAEMKGIFQSLGKIYREPREFLAHAHDALVSTIDKRSFISLIYAVLDLRSGVMSLARAGHCPMLYVSKDTVEYIKPTGLALGMGSSELFTRTIAQENVRFSAGDVAVFYTDGLTEAHPKGGPEFGYEQLQDVVRAVGHKSAVDVRDAIISDVDKHMQHESPEDDLTIVVMKWVKPN